MDMCFLKVPALFAPAVHVFRSVWIIDVIIERYRPDMSYSISVPPNPPSSVLGYRFRFRFVCAHIFQSSRKIIADRSNYPRGFGRIMTTSVSRRKCTNSFQAMVADT
jgi:hypothetical protein